MFAATSMSVVENSTGKKHLEINVRHVYQCLKFEDLREGSIDVLRTGDFAFTFNLKSGYHHTYQDV